MLLLLIVFLLDFSLGGLSYFSLNLINSQIIIFTSCIHLVALNFPHIQPTTLLVIKGMIVVKEINRTMYVVRHVSRHERRWSLAIQRFIMYMMTLIHCHILTNKSFLILFLPNIGEYGG